MITIAPHLSVRSPPSHSPGGCAKYGLQRRNHNSVRTANFSDKPLLEALPTLSKAVVATSVASEPAKLQTDPMALEVGQQLELDCTALAFGGQVGCKAPIPMPEISFA